MLTLLTLTVLFQTISGQCIPNRGIPIEETISYQESFNPNIFRGPGLKVTSFSPAPASGITVKSDNLLAEGPLTVAGHLPFLGVVTLDGSLPALGEGIVAYSCGSGNIGIIPEEMGLGSVKGFADGPSYAIGYGPIE